MKPTVHKIGKVKLPINNNARIIFEFLRDYLTPTNNYYICFSDNTFILLYFYSLFNFDEKTIKLIRCTKW